MTSDKLMIKRRLGNNLLAPIPGEGYGDWVQRFWQVSEDLTCPDDPRLAELSFIHEAIMEHLCKYYGMDVSRNEDGEPLLPWEFRPAAAAGHLN